MSKGIEAMQTASLFQSKSWHPEAGHLWDAHEQLAEMYMIRNETGDVPLALGAYEKAIQVYPNRYHSLAGAARCAELLENRNKACSYYMELTKLTFPDGLPTVTFDGLERTVCPKYKPDRRPALVAGLNYLKNQCGGGMY